MSDDLIEKKPEPVDAVSEVLSQSQPGAGGLKGKMMAAMPLMAVLGLALSFSGVEGLSRNEGMAQDAMRKFVRQGLEATGVGDGATAMFPNEIDRIERKGEIFELASYVDCVDESGEIARVEFEVAVRQRGDHWRVQSLTLPPAMPATMASPGR